MECLLDNKSIKVCITWVPSEECHMITIHNLDAEEVDGKESLTPSFGVDKEDIILLATTLLEYCKELRIYENNDR